MVLILRKVLEYEQFHMVFVFISSVKKVETLRIKLIQTSISLAVQITNIYYNYDCFYTF